MRFSSIFAILVAVRGRKVYKPPLSFPPPMGTETPTTQKLTETPTTPQFTPVKEVTPLIRRTEIENYGIVRHAELEFRPVTVLYGPNSSGKTTILNAIECAIKKTMGYECKLVGSSGVIKLTLGDGDEVTYYVGNGRVTGGTSLQLMKTPPITHINVGKITMKQLCTVFSKLMSELGIRAIWDVLRELESLFTTQKDGVLYDYDFIYYGADLECDGELVKYAIKEGDNYGIRKYKNVVATVPVSESEIKFATLLAHAYLLYRKFAVRGITPVMLLEKPESGFHVRTLVDLLDELNYFDIQLVVETTSGLALQYGIKHGVSYLVKNGEVKRLSFEDLKNRELFYDEYKTLLSVV